MLIVIPNEQFEEVANQADSWVLLGPDDMGFDEANGYLEVIENHWQELL